MTKRAILWTATALSLLDHASGYASTPRTGQPGSPQTAGRNQFPAKTREAATHSGETVFNRPQELKSCPSDSDQSAQMLDSVHYPLGVSFRKFKQIMDSHGMGAYLERLPPDKLIQGYKIRANSPQRPSLQGQPWSAIYCFATIGGVYRLMGISGSFDTSSSPAIVSWLHQEFGEPTVSSNNLIFKNENNHPAVVVKAVVKADESIALTLLDPFVLGGASAPKQQSSTPVSEPEMPLPASASNPAFREWLQKRCEKLPMIKVAENMHRLDDENGRWLVQSILYKRFKDTQSADLNLVFWYLLEKRDRAAVDVRNCLLVRNSDPLAEAPDDTLIHWLSNLNVENPWYSEFFNAFDHRCAKVPVSTITKALKAVPQTSTYAEILKRRIDERNLAK